MKLNPYILLLVVAAAIYIGININEESLLQTEINKTSTHAKQAAQKTAVKSIQDTPDISPEHIMEHLQKNGFEILPISAGKTTDIYTGTMALNNSNFVLQVDVYFERSSQKVLLIETNIDASAYIDHPDQSEVENTVNKMAENYFIPIAKIPFKGTEENEAGEWVKANIHNSYSNATKEKTSTQVGAATINIFGNPLMRTLEIDFGF
ncbi:MULTISPECIES: hypothetical protein [Bacillaceae]|uniref:hypothetical protein n=1 Tax=Bacillaceae TaxID=186817 RepID=UPI0029651EAA|nr:hypothetical protein [Bacillus infantis]MDW2876490.1 hypothetical protein [Bacillus infantis]